MEEQFEYGEEVLVRDHDTEEWQKRHYLMTAPEGKFRYFTVYPETRLDGFRISQFAVYPFAQIRKIQKDKTKSPETNPTRKEEAQLRNDANWAIEQAIASGTNVHEFEETGMHLLIARNRLLNKMQHLRKKNNTKER